MVKRYRKKDPYHSREASEYDKPVASREYILQYLEEQGRPVTFRHLLAAFVIEDEDMQEGLRRRLRAMERDGQIISNRRGSYALVNQLELIRGRVVGHRDGFGFLISDEAGDDIFLPARQMRSVFSGDRVLVRVTGFDYRGRREGAVVEVLERNTHQVVGRYSRDGHLAFVNPDNKKITQDVIIAKGDEGRAKPGQFVVVEIVSQPSRRRQPMGKVIDVLGDQLTPGMEVELAIRSHELPFTWPEVVTQAAQKFKASVPKTALYLTLNLL